LAPKSNCQKGNAPENDFSSGADASQFGLHGSPRERMNSNFAGQTIKIRTYRSEQQQ
jgi:hypothetical protein